MAEINVTPLVDVVLVLLIVFMVTAPMMTKGLEVDLPKVTARPLHQKTRPLVVTVRADGSVALDRIRVSLEELPGLLADRRARRRGAQVLLRADRRVPYGVVAEVVAAVRAAGIEDLGLVTEAAPPRTEGRREGR
ncbi:protein TolR [Dissulfurirhabdus thermomarina]|uniref:Protein TolR n=2 Tax=Dissulfurirhabdus thermomarina TaxID=1765737 RepID=A0A6N9TQJ4_DISTH|nr:biopolymer transporter ExbD [Dissulfurirhabdus thermomarina]NDY43535.1 protein TolR [Dissulfurirhabdus thermomarina]NMX22920.1 protein TolR [Dissulfurirhabdus thermomarina]